jgi:NAD(P)H-hydrate epimerase
MTRRAKVRPLSRDEVRSIDQRAWDELGIPGIVLMENAGRGAAEALLRRGIDGPVVICCGKGNNGGDGFVIARHLDQAGVDVEIWLFAAGSRLSGDALANYEIARGSELPIHEHPTVLPFESFKEALASADWVIDALLGTGVQGEVTGLLREVIQAINLSGTKVLAVDLPSGMDADTGRPLGVCIKATCTVTFVARKIGFDNPDSSQWTGEVEIADIGLPRKLLNEFVVGE